MSRQDKKTKFRCFFVKFTYLDKLLLLGYLPLICARVGCGKDNFDFDHNLITVLQARQLAYVLAFALNGLREPWQR